MATAARSYSRRDTILLAACLVLALIARVLPDRTRDPLAATLRHTVLAPLVALQRDAELTHRAWLTREDRVATRDSVVLRSMALDAVRQDNDHLRALLGLGARLQWGFVPAEVLQGRGVGEEYTVALSAGSRAGVREFSPVIAPGGLVGMVKTVDPTMSIAIVWSHPDFRVSAMSADGGAFGIVAAHGSSEPERYLLEMRGVPVRTLLKPGTLIVSSGLGSTFPQGIPVGTVLGEMKTSELWARTYLLRPAVLPSEMTSVMVLRPERVASGVDGVWRTGVHIDSAVKTVVAAGEALERAARAAAHADSVRTDSLRALRADSASRQDSVVRR